MTMKSLAFLFVALIIGKSGFACQPTDSDLQKYFQWTRDGDKGYAMEPVFVQNATKFRNFDVFQLDFLRDQVLLGRTACENAKESQTVQADLHDRSLCPWYWRSDFDPRRIPTAVPTARCACEKQKVAGTEFECHLMKYKIRVMRFVGDEGKCDQMEPGELDVGVACVAAPVAQQLGRPPAEVNLFEPDF